jgi:L-ascorbate metabolism protein UlaG (beta-lactamase superfamily)
VQSQRISSALLDRGHVKALSFLSIAAILSGVILQAQSPLSTVQLEIADRACQSAQLVSTGAEFPSDRHTLAVRWTGYSNFELAQDGHVILLDAYFDRGTMYPPLGFKAADIRRADVVLLGHGHYDHMSDAASVAAKTGAIVVGAPVTVEQLKREALSANQLRTVTGRGGEVLSFPGFTVEPILGRHGEPPRDVTSAFSTALRATAGEPTPQQVAEQALIIARGTSDPRVIAGGTIAYLITLDTGFRILYRDSGGAVTEYERAAANRSGPVDLILAATSASYVTSLIIDQALEYVRTYRPRVFMPAHHDAPLNNLWRPTEPIFQAIKDRNPTIMTISKGYREPTCFKTEVRR